MTPALRPRGTRLAAALPAMTKREARLVAAVISAAVRELCDHEYRALVDFTVDDERVDEIIVDFLLEPVAATQPEPPSRSLRGHHRP